MMRAVVLVALGITLFGSLENIEAGQFVIVNLDPPNAGLNDPEPVSPVGGNDGTTLGEQRMNVLEAAAARWANFLELTVEIRVGATFEELECDPTSGVLGTAGPNNVAANFTGAPVADTWYTIAQAITLAESDLILADNQHISTRYNVRLDDGDSDCLGGNTWYYGLDDEGPFGTVPLFPVVLHELAHGLGFLTLVDLESGARLETGDGDPLNDAYMLFLRDQEVEKDWPDMTDAERVDSAVNDPNVVWTGPTVDAMSNMVTDPAAFSGGLLRVHAPGEIEDGSSISHWTPDADPPLLMEPARQPGIFDELDLTPALFSDIGWPVNFPGIEIFRDRFEP